MSKVNPDYSASAVNLTNPPEVKRLLSELKICEHERDIILNELDQVAPKLKADLTHVNDTITSIEKQMRLVIDEYGSYQDIDLGEYAVKQRRVSLTYSPTCFRERFPLLAPFAITEVLEQKKVEGMLKGGLLKQEELDTLPGTLTKETFAYIIK